jgi:heptosyltransferase-3
MRLRDFAIHSLRLFYRKKFGSPAVPCHPKSLVLLAPERYGDLILLTPLIKYMYQAYSDIQITLVGVNDLVYFFKEDHHVQHIYNGKKMLYRMHSLLFREFYDMLYNPKDHPSFVFLLLSCRINAGYKIGIDHPLHHKFYHRLLPAEANWSKLHINCALLSFLKIQLPAAAKLRPYLPSGPVSEEIKQFVHQCVKKNTVALNLSASNPIRQWPASHWHSFLDHITEPAVIIAMPPQAAEKKILETQCHAVIASPQSRTLFDAIYIIAACRLLISPDTALIHVASALNLPVIGLYTHRSEYAKFAALSDIQQILFSENDAIHSISPQQVLTAYHTIVKQISSEMQLL